LISTSWTKLKLRNSLDSTCIKVVLSQATHSELLIFKVLILRLAVVLIAITLLKLDGLDSLKHKESLMVSFVFTMSLKKEQSKYSMKSTRFY